MRNKKWMRAARVAVAGLVVAATIATSLVGCASVITGAATGIRSDYTVDDLRDTVYHERIFTDEVACTYLVALYENGAGTEEIVAAEAKLGVKYEGAALALRYMVEQAVATANTFYESMASGASASKVLSDLSLAEKARDAYELEAGSNAYKYSSRSDVAIRNILSEIDAYIINREDDNIIGSIGAALDLFVERWEIEDVHYEGYHEGLTIKNSSTKYEDVNAQFSGIVTGIELHDDGKIDVEVTCGYGMGYYVIGMGSCDVVVGQYAHQYDRIGTIPAGGSVTLQIILDGEQIDPLLVYGSVGAYERNLWVQRNPAKVQEIGQDNVESFVAGKNAPDGIAGALEGERTELVDPGSGVDTYEEDEDRNNTIGQSAASSLPKPPEWSDDLEDSADIEDDSSGQEDEIGVDSIEDGAIDE